MPLASERLVRTSRDFALPLLLVILSGASGIASEGTAGDQLDLARALEMALDGSHELGAADARAQAATGGVGEARAARLPRVTFSEHGSRSTNPTLVFSGLLNQERFAESDFDPDRLNQPDPLTDFVTRLSVYQPLYAAGRLNGGVDRAEMGRLASEERLERTRQQVTFDVVAAYVAAHVAQGQLEVARQARETAEANIELARDLFEVGLVVESDLLQARVRESEIAELEIRAEGAVDVTQATLNVVMGQPVERRWSLVEPLGKSPQPGADASSDLDALITEALEGRPDRRAAAFDVEGAEHSAKVARSGWKPELGLAANLEAHGEDPFGADGDNWSVFLRLDFDLFDGFATRSRVARAEEELRGAREMAAALDGRIGLDVLRARSELDAARKRLEQATRAGALAERSLSIVQDRYKEGLATLVELLEAETSMTRARAREVSANGDVVVAETALDLALGRL